MADQLPLELNRYNEFNSTRKAVKRLLHKNSKLERLLIDALIDEDIQKAVFAYRQHLWNHQRDEAAKIGREIDPENPPADGTLKGRENPILEIGGKVGRELSYFNVSPDPHNQEFAFYMGAVFTRIRVPLLGFLQEVKRMVVEQGVRNTSFVLKGYQRHSEFEKKGVCIFLTSLSEGAKALSERGFFDYAEVAGYLSTKPILLEDFVYWSDSTKGFDNKEGKYRSRRTLQQFETALILLKRFGLQRIVEAMPNLKGFPLSYHEGLVGGYHGTEAEYEASGYKKEEMDRDYCRVMQDFFTVAQFGSLETLESMYKFIHAIDSGAEQFPKYGAPYMYHTMRSLLASKDPKKIVPSVLHWETMFP